MADARTIRIGIDTGGTFTDVVAFDEATGELVTTKTPSTPGNPADGFMAGIEKVLGLVGGGRIAAVIARDDGGHEPAARGQGREARVRHQHRLRGDARDRAAVGAGRLRQLLLLGQAGPDRARATWSGASRGAWTSPAREVRPFDEDGARAVARWFRERGIDTLGVCFLHSYANPDHEERMRAVLAEEHPDAVVSLSSQVLREYREYERAMTTLVDAAVKPRVSRYVDNIKDRLAAYAGPDGQSVPFYVMKSNGGVLSADEVVHQPITTVLSGPAAGALGAALIAKVAGFDRVLTSDGGGTSTDVSVVIDGEPTLTTEGTVGVYPSKIPMIDVVTVGAGGGSIAWLSPEGTLKVGPQSAGADPGPLCYGKGGAEVTITDAHVVLGRIPPHLLGGEIPLDVEAARAGVETLAGKLGLTPEACATGVLEISAWNQANALRQVTVKRGLDVRDFTLTTFGGSGSLLLCRLMDVLGIPRVLVPPDPGNVSAFGLLTVDVKNDYVQTHVSLDPQPADVQAVLDALTGEAHAALAKEGFAEEQRQFARTADLRYFGQAFEVRVPVPEGDVDAGTLAAVADLFHAEHRALYGYDFAGDADPAGRVGEPAGVGDRADHAAGDPGLDAARRHGVSTGSTSGEDQTGLLRRGRRVRGDAGDVARRPGPGHGRRGAGDPRGVRVDGAAAPGLHGADRRLPQPDRGEERLMSRRAPTDFPFGSLTDDAGASADPVLVEIVQGSLASVEMEVETAIARTSRSPMIRDAHDFRAGIHDRLLRKLTGRSYSALVHPVARDFPIADDAAGRRVLPQRRLPLRGRHRAPARPVRHGAGVLRAGRVVAFVQAFGHHDDIGGAVPGSMPCHATSVFEEGLMVPPIRLWDAGVPNRAALAIMTRNSRMPESLAADLDAECSACLMGARRLGELFDRYGVATVESCFDAIIDRTTTTYRREILSQIPVGQWVWEDYAEHDGVDEPRLHTQRITLTRTAGRRPRRRTAGPRLRRHRAAGQGADQPLRRLRRRGLPQEVAGADPAQPRREPGADGRARRQRGRRAADRDALPRARHAAHAGVPGADQRPHVRDPAAARRARRRGRQGGRRPDAGRPGDDPLHRRVRRGPGRPAVPDARGARRRLRRPLLRRRRGHDPRRTGLAEPADRVHRGPLPVPGRVAVARGRLRRRRAVPRRPRLREADPDARATRTSCRSRTARSWPAGASRAAGPASRSRSRSTPAAPPSARSTRSPTPSPCGPAS